MTDFTRVCVDVPNICWLTTALGTFGGLAHWRSMDVQTADRFRKRAQECRQMAQEVREPDWIKKLLAIAEDLEGEVNKIEAANDRG